MSDKQMMSCSSLRPISVIHRNKAAQGHLIHSMCFLSLYRWPLLYRNCIKWLFFLSLVDRIIDLVPDVVAAAESICIKTNGSGERRQRWLGTIRKKCATIGEEENIPPPQLREHYSRKGATSTKLRLGFTTAFSLIKMSSDDDISAASHKMSPQPEVESLQ